MRGTGKPYDKDSTDSGPRDNRAQRESLFEPYEIGAGHRDHLHHHQGDDEFPSCLCLFDAEFNREPTNMGQKTKAVFRKVKRNRWKSDLFCRISFKNSAVRVFTN